MGERRMTLDFICVVIAVACAVKSARSDENEYRLVRDLLVGYDKRVRPSLNHTQSLNVTFGVALAQIIDVDMKNQILTSNCWLNQIWTDVGLQWDPDKYGGIRVLRIPYDEVWRPDILLYNNADVSSYFSSISSNVIVTNDGNVTWLCMVIFKSSCPINVRYFPFDWQNCSMWFASWTYDGFQINLVINSPEGDISNFVPNSEWQLVAMKVIRNERFYSCCKEPYPDITCYIVLRRRPLFYIFNMILPCILITLVALLGFYIPSDSGEKVTMGITTLLSMTVFMMLVTENMPPTSDVLPLIGIYYGMTIFIVSFATGMTVFTLNIHHKGVRGKEVPAFIKLICFRFLARFFCIRIHTSASGSLVNDAFFIPECNGTAGGSRYTRYKLAPHQSRCKVPSAVANKTGRGQVSMARVDIPLGNKHDDHQHHHNTPSAPPSSGNATHPLSPPHPRNITTTTSLLSPSQRHDQEPFILPTHSCTCTSLPPPPRSPSTSPSPGSGEVFFQGGGELVDRHQLSGVLHTICQTMERNERRVQERERREVIKVQWQQVAQITDRVLLLCFVTATVTITGVVLFQSPQEYHV